MTVFEDQAQFMQACEQTVGVFNTDQFRLYLGLIEEEHKELKVAVNNSDQVQTLDALIDIMVVTIGAMHSLGVDIHGAWQEVMRSNLTKIDSETKKITRRADGKVLKPATWQPPDLKPYVKS